MDSMSKPKAKPVCSNCGKKHPPLAAMAKDSGVSLPDAERYWDDAKKSAADQGRDKDYAYIMGIVKKRMGLGEWRPHPVDETGEEITTTANLAPGNIARTSPNEEAPHVCTNCGYGSSGDEGGTCPKCGGRMAERAKWIRELIDRVRAGESASNVLNTILR